MKTYEAKGTYTTKGETHAFGIKVNAENDKTAKEKVYAAISGKQAIRRINIVITELKVAN